jgi:hypothetical protein
MFAVAAIVFGACLAVTADAADSTQRTVIGQWKITAALDSADITSLDDQEARKLLGRTLTINRKHFKFGERTCTSPDFAAELVDPALYLREHYRASASQLGLPNPVTIVHLECTSAFIKDRNRLVIFWKGWFFEAVRTRP